MPANSGCCSAAAVAATDNRGARSVAGRSLMSPPIVFLSNGPMLASSPRKGEPMLMTMMIEELVSVSWLADGPFFSPGSVQYSFPLAQKFELASKAAKKKSAAVRCQSQGKRRYRTSRPTCYLTSDASLCHSDDARRLPVTDQRTLLLPTYLPTYLVPRLT